MERIYLDTSVFGGYYESEFEFWTRILFSEIEKGKFEIVFSEVLESELINAPKRVKDLTKKLPEELVNFVALTNETVELANQYVEEQVVGRTSLMDCFHIAVATLNNADVLVSWNFKHIVNFKRIRGYNAVNYKFGHKLLDIRTPREILEYEN